MTTKRTEIVELNEAEMEDVQGAGFVPGPLSVKKNSLGQNGIIVVDEDGLSGPNDQFPG